MPILADLSRRFHMLTTDAKPDPPRILIEGYTHNLQPSEETKKKSSTPKKEQPRDVGESLPRVESETVETTRANADSIPREQNIGDVGSSTEEPREHKKPNVKTKTRTKSKQAKHSQSANIVNYNIINSNGVKIGSKTSYICYVNHLPENNSKSSEFNWSKSKSQPMPQNVELLSSCCDEITFKDMFVIKTHIGNGWRDVARRFSYSEGQIEQFEENYRHRGISEVIYQILLDWKQVNTKNAQIGNLVWILWSCQEYNCAERLAEERLILR